MLISDRESNKFFHSGIPGQKDKNLSITQLTQKIVSSLSET